MTILFQQNNRASSIRIAEGKTATLHVQQGMHYRLIDSETGLAPKGVISQQQGDQLKLIVPQSNTHLLIPNFWTDCQVGAGQCYIDLPQIDTTGHTSFATLTQTATNQPSLNMIAPAHPHDAWTLSDFFWISNSFLLLGGVIHAQQTQQNNFANTPLNNTHVVINKPPVTSDTSATPIADAVEQVSTLTATNNEPVETLMPTTSTTFTLPADPPTVAPSVTVQHTPYQVIPSLLEIPAHHWYKDAVL